MEQITSESNLKEMIETYTPTYRVLLMNGIKVNPFNIEIDMKVGDVTAGHNNEQMVYEHLNKVKDMQDNKTDKLDFVKRNIIKPDKINISGFTDFIWHDQFMEEIHSFCEESKIDINPLFFSKYDKKSLQLYLCKCRNEEELPDILIGKGFSTLMSRHFTDRFIKTGVFDRKLDVNIKDLWYEAGIKDPADRYHVFGVQEDMIMQDMSIKTDVAPPKRWSDLQKPEYYNTVTQMGKPQRDHFGFNTMFYLYKEFGEKGIRDYANSVKYKWHFSRIVKDLGKESPSSSPYNVVHSFATLFFRNNPVAKVLRPTDGNPVTSVFCLVKKNAPEGAVKIAQHLFSEKIGRILTSTAGIISANPALADNQDLKIRWIGWDNIMNSTLPYLKDDLSEIAYSVYDRKEIKDNHGNKINKKKCLV